VTTPLRITEIVDALPSDVDEHVRIEIEGAEVAIVEGWPASLRASMADRLDDMTRGGIQALRLAAAELRVP
jgi:hypothetical protein